MNIEKLKIMLKVLVLGICLGFLAQDKNTSTSERLKKNEIDDRVSEENSREVYVPLFKSFFFTDITFFNSTQLSGKLFLNKPDSTL